LLIEKPSVFSAALLPKKLLQDGRKTVHAPKGADEIADFVGGDQRVRNPAAAGPIWKRSFQIDKALLPKKLLRNGRQTVHAPKGADEIVDFVGGDQRVRDRSKTEFSSG